MIGRRKNKESVEISSSSMADIAFLLLVFFLVVTKVNVTESGLQQTLPRIIENEEEIVILDRELYNIQINKNNELLIEGEDIVKMEELRGLVKKFIVNPTQDLTLSSSPEKAIVSLKVDEGTKYNVFLSALSEIQGAYNELRAELLGISVKEYLLLDKNKASDSRLLLKATKAFPQRLSRAEATKFAKEGGDNG